MKTPTTVLLVVIAALLAANLFVNLPSQEATAQSSLRVAEVPHVIQVEAGGINARVYRLWSDGVIEEAVFESISSCLPDEPPTGFAWQEIPESMPPHGVRITRIYTRGHSGTTLLRLRSDGVVEQNYLSGTPDWCGWRTPPE